PTVAAGDDVVLSPGDVLNRKGSFTDPGADTWTAAVDYGDGSGPQELKLDHDKTFHLHHKYDSAGAFVVTVTVRDDDGGVGTGQFVGRTSAAPAPAVDHAFEALGQSALVALLDDLEHHRHDL